MENGMDERPRFLIPEPLATLVLDTPPFVGAEIEVSLTLSPDNYFAAMDLLGRLGEDDTTKAGLMEVARELAQFFAARGLRTWNLRNDAGPIPADLTGLLSLDVRLLTTIVSTWIMWLGNAPIPLPEASTEPTAPPKRRSKRPRRSTPGPSVTAISPRTSTAPTSRASSGSAA
jgi:hypothetical protein